MRRRHLDDDSVAKLRALGKRYNQPDTELPGHYVRVSPTGVKSYWVATRAPGNETYTWKPIGAPPMPLAEAREIAKKTLRSIRGGNSPQRGVDRRAMAQAARWQATAQTRVEYDRAIRDMVAAWGQRDFGLIERDDLTKLLDQIESERGTRAANYFCKPFRPWLTGTPPVRGTIAPHWCKGCAGVTSQARPYIERRRAYGLCGRLPRPTGTFGALVRLALLTAQRQDKLASMKWEDVQDGVWTIATEEQGEGQRGGVGAAGCGGCNPGLCHL